MKERSVEIIRELIDHLPDSNNQDNDWNYCWNELTDESQEKVKAIRKKAIEYLKEHDEPKEMRAGSPKYQDDTDIINSIIYEIRNSGNRKPGAHLYLGYKQIRALNTIEKGDPQEVKNSRFCGFPIVVVEKEYWCKLLA